MNYCSPAPQGAGGLKISGGFVGFGASGPAPQGAGGLKMDFGETVEEIFGSRPARGGWIEKINCAHVSGYPVVPPRKGRVD